MDFSFPPEVEALRRRVNVFLDANWPSEYRRYAMNDSVARDLPAADVTIGDLDRETIRRFYLRLGEAGLLGFGIPQSAGGQGGGPLERYVVEFELAAAGAPFPNTALGTVAPTLVWLGDASLQQRFIPDIVSGCAEFALGYTEPEAGTDLASLRTKATLCGDGFVINGQKIFSSAVHYADYYWLAARTDAEATKHRGISVFIVPRDTPGMTITPLRTMSGIRTNIVFLDDVEVSVDNLVGVENDGWRVVTYALAHERYTAILASPILAAVDAAAEQFAHYRGDPGYDEVLGRLSMDARAARLLGQFAAWSASENRPIVAVASGMKVFISELRYRISRTVLDLLGADAVLAEGDPDAPAEGQFERMHRHAPITLFTAGANAVQRDIVAEVGLGMPRSR